MRYFSAGRLALTALMFSVVSLTGCMSTMGPKMPKELGAPSLSIYSGTEFNTNVAAYREAVAKGDLTAARALRNQIVYRVMADVETGYGKFEMHLTTTRAGAQTGSDAIQLGLTAATTVVGASDIKDILSATSTAFHGTWTSLDKNYFQDKTTEAILSQMRATRKTKQAQIITSLTNRDVSSYPLDAAWIDLVDFYYAGTVPSALVEISSSAGASAEQASAELDSALAKAAKQAISVRTAYQKLSTAATGTDEAAKASAITSLKNILKAAGYAPAENATAADLLTLFRKAMSDADPDADPKGDKLKALNEAVAAANLN
jgi:hypothetical protein